MKKGTALALMAASMSLGSFYGGFKFKSGNVKGFKGYPGNARAKGKAKRKAKLRALKKS